MSKRSHVHTIRLPLRKIGSAIPAVALIGGAIMLPTSATPTASGIGLASSTSPAVAVPNTEPASPGSPGSPQSMTDASPEQTPRAPASQPPASLLPAGTAAGSSSPVTLDTSGIPVRALEGYRKAATLISAADPSCHLDWALLGAIGRVESNHARFGGNQLDSAGTAQPGIIGVALDGSNGTARITDTDHGLLDRDTTYDRAVGPMQFIPSTWRSVGVDANGDGVKDPQNMADAATATAVYLCSGGGDLTNPTGLRAAILHYNASDSYASMVTAIADAYRHGVRALPASDLAPAKATTVATRTSVMVKKPVSPATAKPAASRPASTPAKATAPKPVVTPWPSVTIRPTSAPTTSTPTPTLPVPTTSKPAAPAPAITCVPILAANGTASPTSTATASASPAPAQTCLPPCPAASTASPTATASASPAPAQTCLPPCEAVSTASPTAPTTAGQPCLAPTAAPSSTATP